MLNLTLLLQFCRTHCHSDLPCRRRRDPSVLSCGCGCRTRASRLNHMVISAKTLRAGGHAPTSFRSGGTGPHDSDSWVELNMPEMSSSAHLAVSPHELPRLHFSGPAKSVVRPLQVWDGPGGTVPTSTKSDIRFPRLCHLRRATPASRGLIRLLPKFCRADGLRRRPRHPRPRSSRLPAEAQGWTNPRHGARCGTAACAAFWKDSAP